jgi:ABC-type sugar transport system substrate-binding protein
MKSTTDIRSIVRDGGNIIISSSKSTTDIRSIVREAKQAGTQVTITNASKKSTTDLRAIIREYPRGVTLELDI